MNRPNKNICMICGKHRKQLGCSMVIRIRVVKVSDDYTFVHCVRCQDKGLAT